MKKWQKITVAGVSGALLLAAGALGGVHSQQSAIADEVQKVVDKDAIIQEKDSLISQLNDSIKELEGVEPEIIIKNVTVEKEVEVEVDNGNLDLVLQHIYDNDGNVEYLTEDLDDDEVSLIVDRVVFVNDIKALAIEEVEDSGVKELDDEEVNGTIIDRHDIERFKVYDDDEDIVVESVDFEDGDADVLVSVKFEQDDVKYKATFKVEFKDGDVEDISVEEVELR